jgi:hypothetical protein
MGNVHSCAEGSKRTISLSAHSPFRIQLHADNDFLRSFPIVVTVKPNAILRKSQDF